jgi:carboxypeptidase C (cathepsin A)
MASSRPRLPALLLAMLLVGLVPVHAQERAAPQEKPPSQPQSNAKAGPGLLALLPPDSVTTHTIATETGPLSYRATAGTLPVFDASGERKAEIFYTAYVRDRDASAPRPLTFAFNGGPGAASAFLHLGLVGPKIAHFGDGTQGSAATLRDNPQTWLQFTDLVLIDPVGTGWSRTAKADDARNYWNVRDDAQVMAKIIALYLARNGRTTSPKYLLGESYGGFRAAKVARALQRDQGIVVTGIIMLSPLLDSGYTFDGDRFSLGCALQLPSIVAAELDARNAFAPQALADAERFAMTDYLTTLASPAPQGKTAEAFYGRIAQLTGLTPEAVTNARGCVRDAYLDHRHRNQTPSAYDASFLAPDPFPDQERRHAPDPILDGFVRALGGLFADYARNELGFKTDITYVLLAQDIAGRWDWQASSRGTRPGVMGDIRELLALDPAFRLLVAHGRADLVTPYGVSRYLLQHLPAIGGGERARLRIYPGGHMLYLNTEARLQFTKDARAFYQTAE